MKSLALVTLCLFLLVAHALSCTPSKKNRERTTKTIKMYCSNYGYTCNVGDLTQSGKVLGNTRVPTLGIGSCRVEIQPNYYGEGVARCRLVVKGPATVSSGVGASISGPSVQTSVSQEVETAREYRNNCSGWCGDYTESSSGAAKKWSKNTYVRCYGKSNCSKSKCLKDIPWYKLKPGYWYEW